MTQAKFNIVVNNQAFYDHFVEIFRDEVIQNGLDEIIESTLYDIKNVLQSSLDDIKFTPTFAEQEVKDLTEGKTPKIKMSDKTVMNGLFDVKWDQLNKEGSAYTSTSNSTGFIISYGKNIAVRTPVQSGDDLKGKLNQAVEHYNKSTIAIKDGENFRYFVNNGEDFRYDVKIVCSTDRGVTENAESRFQRDIDTKGHSHFELKQETVSDILNGRKKMEEVTSVVEAVKKGDLDEASNIIRLKPQTPKIQELRRTIGGYQIEEIRRAEKTNTTSQQITNGKELLALIKIQNFINTIRISKRISKDKTEYFIAYVDEQGSKNELNRDFYSNLQKLINQWVKKYELKWFNTLVKKTQDIIDSFTESMFK